METKLTMDMRKKKVSEKEIQMCYVKEKKRNKQTNRKVFSVKERNEMDGEKNKKIKK